MQRNITKKYLRQIRRLYKGKHKIKKNFLDELEQDLLHYQKTHPNADYNDLLTQFGEPSEIQNIDRKSTRLNSSHMPKSRMPSSA